jgi:hypothetical protein
MARHHGCVDFMRALRLVWVLLTNGTAVYVLYTGTRQDVLLNTPRTRESKQSTLVSFCAMGRYPGSRNRVRSLPPPICKVAKSRILRLFRHRVFRNWHSESARPSRTHLTAFRHCGVDFLVRELSALSQMKTHSHRINGQLPCRVTGQLG